MKKTLIKHLSFMVLLCILLGVVTSCNLIPNLGTTDTTTPSGGTWQPPEDEYDIEVPEGYKKVTYRILNMEDSRCLYSNRM